MCISHGDYTLAHHGYYEVIQDPTEVDIVTNTLDLWQRILFENSTLINGFYEALTKPIALLIGVPCCIALIGLILYFFGGKRR